MQQHGPPAPANPSTDGSRQELWPKARSLDGLVSESLETWEARHQRKAAEGINLHRPLPIAVEQEQRKQWATPRSCEHKGNGPNSKQQGLCNQVVPQASATNVTGKLNPRWVETLMGLPIGWVMPSCKSPVTIAPTNCDSSETESCQQQQSELFEF